MRPFERTVAPALLQDFSEKWGEEYVAKKVANSSYRFQWKKHKGKPINSIILPDLKRLTDGHCAYCDSYPPGQFSDNTIDHFLPKGDVRFYSLVYEWTNLYFCCASCQAYKKEQYDQELLRPDEKGYLFSIYFTYDFADHEIKVNPLATKAQRGKANCTLKLLGLNDPKHLRTRRAFYTEYVIEVEKGNSPDLMDFPYRFIFEV